MKINKINQLNPYVISLFYVVSSLIIYLLINYFRVKQLNDLSAIPLLFIVFSTAVLFLLIQYFNRKSKEYNHTLNLIVSAVNNIQEGIVIADQEGSIQWVNPAFCKLTKYPEEELKNMNIRTFLQYDLDPSYYESISKKLKNGETYSDYIINERKSGGLFYEQFTLTPFKSSSDSVSHFIAIFRDITENTLNRISLEESLEEKESLLEEIHHRVKNNLATISGLIELQLFQTENKQIQKILKNTQLRLKSIALVHEKLYNDYLFSNLDIEDYLHDLVDTIVTLYNSDKDISIIFETEPIKLDMVQAVPFGLLATEIITNSYKHAFKGRKDGKITISLKKEKNGNYFFSVKDNGIGLPDNYKLGDSNSLGLKLIQTLSRQIGATIKTNHIDGTGYTLLFDLRKN